MNKRYKSTIGRSSKIILVFLIISTLNSCSILSSRSSNTDHVRSAYMDVDIQDSSRALHHYLIGQMALKDHELSLAMDSLVKTKGLSKAAIPQVNRKLAELYISEGELEKARVELESLLKVSTSEVASNEVTASDLDSLFLYAGVLQSLGEIDASIATYNKIISIDPNNVEAYLLLVSLYEDTGKEKKAISLLQDLLKSNTDKHEIDKSDLALIDYYLGKLLESSDLAAALDAYKKAYISDPNSERALRAYVLLGLKSKEYNKVKSFCKLVIENPQNKAFGKLVLDSLELKNFSSFGDKLAAELEAGDMKFQAGQKELKESARFNLALLFIEQQKLKQALRELNFIIANNPSHPLAAFYIGSIYAGAGKTQQALNYLAKVEPDQNIFIKSRTFGAYLAKQKGKKKEAEKFISEAYEAKPEDDKIFSYYLLILKDNDNNKLAKSLLEKKLKQSHESDEGLYLQYLFRYGIVLHDLGDEEKSIEVMQEIVDKQPEQADALNFIAYSLAERKKDLPRALEYSKRALSVNPKDPFYLDTLGWVHYKLGDLVKAEDSLAQAVTLSGNDSVMLDHYADILNQKGDLAKALAYYRQALELEHDKTDIDQHFVDRVEKKLEILKEKIKKDEASK